MIKVCASKSVYFGRRMALVKVYRFAYAHFISLNKLTNLDISHIIHVIGSLLSRIKWGCDLVGLHQREHVGEDGGVHAQARRVTRVGDHAEHVLQDVSVISLGKEMNEM